MSDPLLITLDDLSALAPSAVVRRAVLYFKEDRVLELGSDDRRLWASVEGSQPHQPHSVEVVADPEGALVATCSCDHEEGPLCHHALSALLAYAARQESPPDAVQSARDEAVRARAKRARTEVVVKHVAGDPTFGTWSAHSLQPTDVGGRTYRVDIRSLGERINHCTCADFATGRLGTCKHIEAVLTKAGSKLGVRARKRCCARQAGAWTGSLRRT